MGRGGEPSEWPCPLHGVNGSVRHQPALAAIHSHRVPRAPVCVCLCQAGRGVPAPSSPPPRGWAGSATGVCLVTGESPRFRGLTGSGQQCPILISVCLTGVCFLLARLPASRPGETTCGAGVLEAFAVSVLRIVTSSHILNSSLGLPSALTSHDLSPGPLGTHQ